MAKKIKIIAFAMLFAATAFASNTIAVLEIVPKSEVNVSIVEMQHLTDELRRQAVLSLPDKGYKILTRDNILSLMPPDEEEAQCLAESCAVEIGRTIGAEYISHGAIGYFSGDLTLSIELYETMSSKLLGSIVMESPDVRGLLVAIREQAPGLFARITRNVSNAVPPPEQKPQIQVQEEIVLPKPIPANVESEKKALYVPLWIAIGVDILGVAALGMGYYFNMKGDEYYTDYQNMEKNLHPSAYDSAFRDVKDAKKVRDISYAAGGALLLGGIILHIWF